MNEAPGRIEKKSGHGFIVTDIDEVDLRFETRNKLIFYPAVISRIEMYCLA